MKAKWVSFRPVAILGLLLGFGFTSTAQIIVNGSFEQGLTGWTANNAGVSLARDPHQMVSSDGTDSVTVGGSNIRGSVLSQTFTVQGGSNYLLSFDFAPINVSQLNARLQVDISTPEGGVLATTTVSGHSPDQNTYTFVPETLSFSIPNGTSSATVSFTDLSDNNGVAVDPIIDRVAVSFAPTAPAQILQNGSFEQGLTGWTANNAGVSLARDPYQMVSSDGTNSVTVGGSNIRGSVLSQIFTVQGGSNYVLSFDFAPINVAQLNARLQVDISTPEGGVIATTTVAGHSPDQNTYTFVPETLSFSIPNGTSSATVSFTDLSDNNGVAVDPIIDNVAVNFSAVTPTNPPTPPVSSSTNVLVNGSFEQGLTGWNGNNGGVTLTRVPDVIVASDGTNSLDLGGGDYPGSVLSQSFAVQGGSNYVLTFDLSTIGDTGFTSQLQIDVSTPEGGLVATTSASQPAQHLPPFTFFPQSLIFHVPDNSSTATITFSDLSPNGGWRVDPVIDNASVTFSAIAPTNPPSTNPPTPPGPHEFINGSFEQGLTGWDANNSGAVLSALPDMLTIASDGTNSASLGGSDIPGSVLSQTFNIASGSYILTFDYSSVGNPGAVVSMQVTVSTPEAGEVATKVFTTSPLSYPAYAFAAQSLAFTIPPGSSSATVSFADASDNGGFQVDPIFDNVAINPSTQSPGVLIYQDTENFTVTGDGKTVASKVNLYLIIDNITKEIQAVRYGTTSKGVKYSTTGALSGYHEFSVTPSKHATNTVWTKAFSGTNSLGQHASFSWALSGANVMLSLGGKGRTFYPRTFSGVVRIVEPVTDGNPVFEQANVIWSFQALDTAASNLKKDSVADAVARIGAKLSGKGYKPVEIKAASSDEDLELP